MNAYETKKETIQNFDPPHPKQFLWAQMSKYSTFINSLFKS